MAKQDPNKLEPRLAEAAVKTTKANQELEEFRQEQRVAAEQLHRLKEEHNTLAEQQRTALDSLRAVETKVEQLQLERGPLQRQVSEALRAKNKLHTEQGQIANDVVAFRQGMDHMRGMAWVELKTAKEKLASTVRYMDGEVAKHEQRQQEILCLAKPHSQPLAVAGRGRRARPPDPTGNNRLAEPLQASAALTAPASATEVGQGAAYGEATAGGAPPPVATVAGTRERGLNIETDIPGNPHLGDGPIESPRIVPKEVKPTPLPTFRGPPALPAAGVAKDCTSRFPVAGDKVRKVQHSSRVSTAGTTDAARDSSNGSHSAWTLEDGQVATVVAVDKDGDFQLRNPAGLVSGWLSRRSFIYEDSRAPTSSALGVSADGGPTGRQSAHSAQGLTPRPSFTARMTPRTDLRDAGQLVLGSL